MYQITKRLKVRQPQANEHNSSNGITGKFHHYRISLDDIELKVGDTFQKLKRAVNCIINESPYCVLSSIKQDKVRS
jgi:hypothetical protein